MCQEGKNELKKCDKYQTFQVKNINTSPTKNEKKNQILSITRAKFFLQMSFIICEMRHLLATVFQLIPFPLFIII